jgi:hypothetical protein
VPKKIQYEIASDAKVIAETLIPQFHDHLTMDDIPLICIFRSEEWNRPVLAKARLVSSGLLMFMAKQFIASVDDRFDEGDTIEKIRMIEIAKPHWEKLDPSQRVALIDHELCHFGAGGGLVEHDLGEFRAVVERHGLWLSDVEAFVQAANKGVSSGAA